MRILFLPLGILSSQTKPLVLFASHQRQLYRLRLFHVAADPPIPKRMWEMLVGTESSSGLGSGAVRFGAGKLNGWFWGKKAA